MIPNKRARSEAKKIRSHRSHAAVFSSCAPGIWRRSDSRPCIVKQAVSRGEGDGKGGVQG
ncbi:hypothetical protein E2C01_059122 [Portunus trituberculatus]|uniref:Uncharacterized protein n=1 Tax=Portunus trituberculatus TaxID=210409 RepID=A0A5B7H584_PORTR|nr:hypothetical protein [Portunus trituberculatus]